MNTVKRASYWKRFPERAKDYEAKPEVKARRNQIARQQRVQNRDKALESERQYRETHRAILNERARLYRAKYPEKVKEANRKSKQRRQVLLHQKYIAIKKAAIKAYGGKCICCGEKEICFLTIDHINNDGGRHRKELSLSGAGIYRWLQKHCYPQGAFQILCWNCNCAKTHSKEDHERIHPNAKKISGNKPALFYE